MRGFLILLRRELQATFTSLGYYVLLAVVAAISSFLFFNELMVSENDVRHALNRSFPWLFGLTMALTPLLTMRLLAEERRSGSLELLMTAPVGDFQVVGSKFASSVVVFATFMAPIWVSHLVLVLVYDAPVEWGQLFATSTGVVGVGLIFLAIGTMASALSNVQLWAALLAFFGNLIVFMLGQFQTQFEAGSTGARIFAYIDLRHHIQSSSLGIIDFRHVVFQLSVTMLLLYWTTRIVETRKWR